MAVPDTSQHPWERIRSETDHEWSIWFEYRQMPPGERTHAELARRLGKQQTYKGYLNRVAKKNQWERRAAAWDQHIGRIQAARYEQTIEDETEEMARRHLKLSKEILDIAQLKVQRIKQLVNRDIQRTGDGSDLRSLDEIPITALAQLVQTASGLERLTRDMSTTNVALKTQIMLPSNLPEASHALVVDQLRELGLLPGSLTDDEILSESNDA